MSEELIYSTFAHSNQIDRFDVMVTPRPDGKVEIRSSLTTKPAIVKVGEVVTFSLKMPFTPDPQPLQMYVTKEVM